MIYSTGSLDLWQLDNEHQTAGGLSTTYFIKNITDFRISFKLGKWLKLWSCTPNSAPSPRAFGQDTWPWPLTPVCKEGRPMNCRTKTKLNVNRSALWQKSVSGLKCRFWTDEASSDQFSDTEKNSALCSRQTRTNGASKQTAVTSLHTRGPADSSGRYRPESTHISLELPVTLMKNTAECVA